MRYVRLDGMRTRGQWRIEKQGEVMRSHKALIFKLWGCETAGNLIIIGWVSEGAEKFPRRSNYITIGPLAFTEITLLFHSGLPPDNPYPTHINIHTKI